MLPYIYSVLIRLVVPFALMRLFWRSLLTRQWPTGWRQRLGYIQPIAEPVIWVHAVSVGETIAAAPLVRGLQSRFPGTAILVTATTITGAQRAREQFGESVHYGYMPYDTPGGVARFLERVRPMAVVIMETELWPNLIRQAHKRQLPVMIINARLSARSAAGYARFSSMTRPMLSRLSWLAVQAEDDARRFIELGVDAQALTVTGNIKFGVTISDAQREQAMALREQLGQGRFIWVAASTHDGEDRVILRAHKKVLAVAPSALLILVPRHPERFDAVQRLVSEMSLSSVRRSSGSSAATTQVYLGDTMGELPTLYGAADLAFIGGSLIERGGHNPLEAAVWSLPVLSGPHIFNFESVYELLKDGNGVGIVQDEAALAASVADLLGDDARRRQLGERAAAVLKQHRGALQKMLDGIARRLEP